MKALAQLWSPIRTRAKKFRSLFHNATRKRTEETLQNASRFNREVIATAAEGIVVYDTELRYQVWNRFMEDMTGLPAAKVLGHKALELFPHLIEQGVDRLLARALVGETVRSPDISYHVPQREKTGWVSCIYNPHRDEQGRIVGVIGIIHDITHRKRAEDALRESESRFRMLVEHIPQKIFIKDRNFRYVSVNENFARVLGVPAAKIVGQDDYAFFPEEQADKFRADDRRIMTTGHPEELLEPDRLGTTCDLTFKSPIRDGQGNIAGVFGIFFDITERKRAEEALRESERLLKESQSIANLGSYVLDIPSGRWKSSEALDALFGIDARYERSVEGWAALIHPDDRAMMVEHFAKEVLGQGQPFDKEYRILRHADRTERRVYGRGKLERDAHGNLLRMLGTIQDITERTRAEQEKDRLMAQLAQAQKMESVGRLAGGVAHDFNNILMGIMGYAELCREKIEPGHPICEWLDEITAGAKRSANLTSQLLAFARKQPIAPKVIDLNAAIDGMLDLLRRLFGEDISLDWRPGADIALVKMDPSQIDQVLTTLAINARDAINGVGGIAIETRHANLDPVYCAEHLGSSPGNYVLMTFLDTGCGMTPETLGHIFEPFFSTKGMGKGTGLGLATVYGIVKQNSGFIDVISEPGQGTTFQIYWPKASATNSPQKADEPRAAVVRGNETILLVEDDDSVRAVTHSFLVKLKYAILVAENPEKALRLAQQHPGEIHLLLTDVIMPGMSGKALAQRLAKFRPSIKCLFISGFTADVLAQRGILDENMHFLPKPFTCDNLVGKIRAVLAT